MGTKEIRKGECKFFLFPGETLEGKIKNIYVLGERDALLVKAKKHYIQKKVHDPALLSSIKQIVAEGEQEEGLLLIKNIRNGNIRPVLKSEMKILKNYEEIYELSENETYSKFVSDQQRTAGEQWMEYGPLSYIPPVEVQVIKRVREIPLDKNEGIYIRNVRSGDVRAVKGKPYMLKSHEQLYEYNLPSIVEKLLGRGERADKSKVVTYWCPFNCAIQISNYKKKTSRIVFGPDFIMLDPDETFTVNVLSGGKPKRPGVIKTLHINLGPDFTSDKIEVETSDHARLSINLSYNWYFKCNRSDSNDSEKLFSIKDFIGDMCTVLAANIRASVAGVNFENFHKGFAKLIRTSIFGIDDNGKVNDERLLTKNNLVITNVDIQEVQPIDLKTRNSLKETVSLAIEITTKTTEENAKREMERAKQESEGQLQRLSIEYKSKAEESRQNLLQLQSEGKEIQDSGKQKAEAEANAEASLIKSKANVEFMKLKSKALKKQSESTLALEKNTNRINIDFEKKMSELTIGKKKQLSEIESKKFSSIINAIGKETLVSISKSGMENQVKLLEGLGLKGFLLTDGKTPVNLFSTAEGLIGKIGKKNLTQ